MLEELELRAPENRYERLATRVKDEVLIPLVARKRFETDGAGRILLQIENPALRDFVTETIRQRLGVVKVEHDRSILSLSREATLDLVLEVGGVPEAQLKELLPADHSVPLAGSELRQIFTEAFVERCGAESASLIFRALEFVATGDVIGLCKHLKEWMA